MNGAELRSVLASVATDLEGHVDEFRKLDAAVGDGDLGITVGAGAAAVRDAVEGLEDDADVATVLRTCAQAIAQANPSTMSALTAGGLLRAAKVVGADPVDLQAGLTAGRTFFETVATKGKSELGDKTILDAIGPSLDALEASIERGGAADSAISDAIEAAQRGVEETAALTSKRGRARWVGERGQGHPDPGAVLYVRFLEAWQRATQG